MRQRVGDERIDGVWEGCAARQTCAHLVVARGTAAARGSHRLKDDVLRFDRGIAAKQERCHAGNLRLTVGTRPFTRDGRTRAGALQGRYARSLPEATHQKGDVGPLSPSVRVQLIEDQEGETGHCRDEGRFGRSRQDEFKHHEVGEQNVRRVFPNLALLGVGLLAGVAPERDRGTFPQKLLQLQFLRVGEGIHRVDDDGANASARPLAQHAVDDRDEVAERLAGTGAGGDDVTVTGGGDLDRLLLMAVQAQWRARGVGDARAPKDVGTARVKHVARDEVFDTVARFERGVELDQRGRPDAVAVELSLNLEGDGVVADEREAADVALVGADDVVAQVEDVARADARRAAIGEAQAPPVLDGARTIAGHAPGALADERLPRFAESGDVGLAWMVHLRCLTRGKGEKRRGEAVDVGSSVWRAKGVWVAEFRPGVARGMWEERVRTDGAGAQALRRAEVDHDNLAIRPAENVRRFQVKVEEVAAVQILQRIDQRRKNIHEVGVAHGRRPVADEVREVAPANLWHRVVGGPVLLEVPEHPDDIRVVEAVQELGLSGETLQGVPELPRRRGGRHGGPALVAGDEVRREQFLDDDRGAVTQLGCPVGDAEATGTEL